MEPLLLISGELLLIPVIAASALVAELVLGLVLGVVQVVLGPLRRRQARTPGVAVRIPGLRLLRRLRSWLVTACMGVIVLLAAADLFFFEAAVRQVLGRLGPSAGLEVEFEQASGSFLAGRMQLDGLVVRREDPAASSALDVRAARFEIDVAMLEVLAPEKRVQALTVDGLQGRVERRPVEREPASAPAVGRRFRVDRLSIADLSVDVVDRTHARPVEVTVEIERMEVAPLRSELALFDLLYAADGNGSVQGLPFEVRTEADDGGRVTTWRAPELPLALASPYLGAGGRMIAGGHLEIEVRDVWRPERDPPEVSMQCRMVLHDLEVAVPDDLGAGERTLAVGMQAAVAKLGAAIPLEFTIDLEEDRFRGAATLESTGLWQAASGALAKAMVEKSGLDAAGLGGRLHSLGKVGGALLDRGDD